MKYQAKIDLDNKNNSHTLAFDRIQQIYNGRRLIILEVGCSTGYFGTALIEHGHEVWGVEPNPLAAEEARKALTCVHTGFIEDFFNEHKDARFDAIVFGDVLEHLVDPALILKRCKNFLKPGGRIVASVPNVAHIAIRAMLLEGRWEYSDLGILDRTHLKFYTRSSLFALFNDADYQVTTIDKVQISAEQVDEICKLNLKKESIALAAKYAKDANGYDFQYVLTAKPAAEAVDSTDKKKAIQTREEGLRILCLVHTTDSSLVDIRLRNPLNRWAALNDGSIRIVSFLEHSMHDLEWGDVFIFQRECSEYSASVFRQLKSAGKKLVFEIDDLLLNLPPFLAHHQTTANKNKKFIIQALKEADVLSVSTPELAEQFSTYNNNIVITPNYAEPLAITSRHFEVPPANIKLIVASSDKVLVDFIVEPLRMIQAEFGTEVIGIGPPSKILNESGITTRHFENMPHRDFKALVASFDNAIGIIPLDDSLFSSCKTAIKYFDYSMAGIPSICSNVLPYKAHIANKENGILVENTTEAWYQAIKDLILHASKRQEISDSAKHYVRKNCNLDISANAWRDLIGSLDVDIKKQHQLKISPLPKRWEILKTLKWAATHLCRYASYEKAYTTFKNHGIAGLVRRVKRI